MKSTVLVTALVLIGLLAPPLVAAQQRPLLTEDPRLITEGTLMTELGFGYFDSVRLPVNGVGGNLLSMVDGGFHFGLARRVEFQVTGVLRNYLWVREGGSGQRNDWGDSQVSTKIALVGAIGGLPDLTLRTTVVLPNSSNESIGKDGTDFFGSLLVGKSIGPAYVFGNLGLGILDDAERASAQQDVLTYGVAAFVPVGRIRLAFEVNGLENPQSNPTVGGEDRAQARAGVQWELFGMRWDLGVTAGLTNLDHRVGVVFGTTKSFTLWR